VTCTYLRRKPLPAGEAPGAGASSVCVRGKMCVSWVGLLQVQSASKSPSFLPITEILTHTSSPNQLISISILSCHPRALVPLTVATAKRGWSFTDSRTNTQQASLQRSKPAYSRPRTPPPILFAHLSSTLRRGLCTHGFLFPAATLSILALPKRERRRRQAHVMHHIIHTHWGRAGRTHRVQALSIEGFRDG
jgi:hypothetical protein